MADTGTIGTTLNALRDRAGFSMRELASRSGYSGASGIQRYLEPSYNKPLSVEVARKFAEALEGKGTPPIRQAEVMELTGFIPPPNAAPFKMEGASMERMREDVPIWGTALGAPEVIDGEAIEQTTLNSGEIVGYAKRPVVLNGRTDVYGLYVQGSSMAPRHEEGDVLFVDPKRTARVGEDVVVYLRPNGEEDDGDRATFVMVKRLVRTTAHYVELEQFSPALTFRIDQSRVLKTHRIIPWRELLS